MSINKGKHDRDSTLISDLNELSFYEFRRNKSNTRDIVI